MQIRQTFPEQKSFDLVEADLSAQPELDAFIEDSYQFPATTDSGEVFIRGNVILSANGRLTDDQGGSSGLSSPLDRKILRYIRNSSEIVLEGASTLHAEGLILPKNALLGVMSQSGVLDFEASQASRERLIIFCSEENYARCSAVYAEDVLDIYPVRPLLVDAANDVVQLLRSRGIHSIVCEGGAKILDAFLEAGLIDELALSHSPVRSESLVALDSWPNRNFSLAQEFESSDGYLFQRWSRIAD
ncbi:MAG: dihydrofolate reductase family protein [Microbacteriaceae bacterium]